MADAESTEVRYDDVTGRKSDILAAIASVEASSGTGTSEQPKPEPENPDPQAQQEQPKEGEQEQHTDGEQQPSEEGLQDQQQQAADEAPQNWKRTDKEAFQALPAEARALVNKIEASRTADYQKKTMELADFRKEYGAVDEMFAPYKERMKASGYTPYQIIQAWQNTERALMDGKGEDVIRDIAKAYNIDLRKVAGVSDQPAAQPQAKRPEDMTDAERAQAELDALLAPKLTPLQQKLDAFEKAEQKRQQEAEQRQRQEQTTAVQRVQNQILSFAQEADPKTKELKHPHFKDVEAAMGTIALSYKQQGLAVPSLEELYETACWSNPAVREALLAKQASDAGRALATTARAKAALATKAAKSVTSSPGLNTPAARANGHDKGQASIRQLIESAWEETNTH